MEQLLKEYEKILTSEGKTSEKFWTLEKRIDQDKRSPGVLVDMRRSQMREDILYLLQYKVIQLSDLEDFSQELRDDVALCMKYYG